MDLYLEKISKQIQKIKQEKIENSKKKSKLIDEKVKILYDNKNYINKQNDKIYNNNHIMKMTKFYILQEKYEKEDITYNENISKNILKYENSADYSEDIDMTDKINMAITHFLPYLTHKKLPERPRKSDRYGFYIENDDFVAFKGLGREMSFFFHMLVVPSIFNCYDEEKNEITLRSIRDLTKEHIPLLNKMKKECITWMKRNKRWFYKIYNFNDMEYWFKEENVTFGFHWPPTIGILHMHFMLGPITEHGENLKDRWVSLDKIIENLNE